MKHGLLALLVALSFSVSVSGNAAGKSRLVNTIQKRVAALPQSAKRLFLPDNGEHALTSKLTAAAIAALISCTSMIACSKSNALRGVERPVVQYMYAPDEVLNRHVHFVIEGSHRVGYVTEALSAHEVSIDPYNGDALPVNIEQIQGTRIHGHDDLMREVMLDSDLPDVKFLHGMVVAVYSSGYYEVTVSAAFDHAGNLNMLANPYTIIIAYEQIPDPEETLLY